MNHPTQYIPISSNQQTNIQAVSPAYYLVNQEQSAMANLQISKEVISIHYYSNAATLMLDIESVIM